MAAHEFRPEIKKINKKVHEFRPDLLRIYDIHAI